MRWAADKNKQGLASDNCRPAKAWHRAITANTENRSLMSAVGQGRRRTRRRLGVQIAASWKIRPTSPRQGPLYRSSQYSACVGAPATMARNGSR
jgi:hypothetical protein